MLLTARKFFNISLLPRKPKPGVFWFSLLPDNITYSLFSEPQETRSLSAWASGHQNLRTHGLFCDTERPPRDHSCARSRSAGGRPCRSQERALLAERSPSHHGRLESPQGPTSTRVVSQDTEARRSTDPAPTRPGRWAGPVLACVSGCFLASKPDDMSNQSVRGSCEFRGRVHFKHVAATCQSCVIRDGRGWGA